MDLSNAPDDKEIYIPLPSRDLMPNLFTSENLVWGLERSGMSDAQSPRYPIP